MSSNSNSKAVTFDAEAVKAQVSKAASDWNAAVKTKRERSFACAVATDAAYRAGLIGKGGMTREEFAGQFVSDTGNGGPVSLTVITMWRRLGNGIRLGVDDKTLTRVMSHFGDSRIGKALEEATSKTAYVKAVNSVHDKAGKFVPKPASKPGKGKGGKPASETAQVPAAGRNNSTRLDAVETNLAALKSLSPAERKRLADIAERIALILDPATPAATEAA